jgi:polyhydroxybutyrate depolymerase
MNKMNSHFRIGVAVRTSSLAISLVSWLSPVVGQVNLLREHSMEVAGQPRRYLVCEMMEGVTPAAILLVLHGGSMDAQKMADLARLHEHATTERLLVVYPEGIDGTWNVHQHPERSDDVEFICRLVDELRRDSSCCRHVFAVGLSAGAAMNHRLAISAAERFDGFINVVGNMPEWKDSTLQLRQPVSVLLVFGKNDPLARYDGGDVVIDGQVIDRVQSVNATVGAYLRCNKNAGPPETRRIPETNVYHLRYRKGECGSQVVIHMMQDGGHCWPGGPPPTDLSLLGNWVMDYSATDATICFIRSCMK